MVRWFRVFVLVVLCGSLATEAQAQRRELVEDLLRTLIESQIKPPQGPPGGPGTPPPPPVGAPLPGGRPDPALAAARTELQHMSAEVLSLTQLVQRESRALPQLRSQLGGLIQLAAALDQLNRIAPLRTTTLGMVAQDFALIDRDWRMIEYQLLQTLDLSPQARQLVQDISQHDRTLCQILGVQPQLDRTELIRLAGELNTNYRQLMDDLYLELRRSPQLPQLLAQGQQVQLQFRQATALIDRAHYDQLVTEYKRCQASWRTFTQTLQPIATDRLRRDMFQVEQSGRAIQQQLWIPVEYDLTFVLQLVLSAEADIQRLMASITLPDLLNHPQPNKVLQAASEFHQTCGSFVTSTRGNPSRDALLWDFRLFDVQWQAFAAECRTLPSPLVQQQVREIENRMTLLRQALGVASGLEPAELTQLAAHIDELCFQFEQTAQQRVLNSGQYDRAFRTQFLQELELLHESAHELHDEVTNHASPRHLAQHVDQLLQSWNSCKARMRQCHLEHQQILLQSVAQLEPLMVNLQVLVLAP